jgi:hypothetical protein
VIRTTGADAPAEYTEGMPALASLVVSVALLPAGHFQLEPGSSTVCLDAIVVDQAPRLRLTFHPPDQRMPAVVEGPYTVSATKLSDFHVTMRVATITQKQLARCRSHWEDVELEATRGLDTTLRPGQSLHLTLHYACGDQGKNTVQLCLHDGGDDGKQVVCRVLTDFSSACEPASRPARR